MKNTSVAGKIASDMAENTREVHEGSKRRLAGQRESFSERHAAVTAPQPGIKEKFAQESAASRERHAEATAPNPGLEKVKGAKGIGGKVSAIAENIVEGARENTEKERSRRVEITHAANPKS